MADRSFALDEKYTLLEGTILLSGVQALVRVLLDRRRDDARRGLNTAGLVSGYRGSPLAGFDLTIERAQKLLDEHQIRFIPGVNEDLGATMLFGSQTANLFPGARYDGVFGMWYGKAPGVDRSGDVFKHANFAGTSRRSGVLVVAGDDPGSKSSTLPSHSEPALYDALMPVLAPASIQDVLDFGRLGYELSRFSGLWVGFKVTNLLADEFGTALVAPHRPPVIVPDLEIRGQPWHASQTHTLGAPRALALEQEIYEGRLVAARAFAGANRIDRIAVDPADAWITIAAAGKTFSEVRQALALLDLSDDVLARYGVRLLQLGMVFPLDESVISRAARGVEELVIVEEKRPFIELFARDLFYHRADRPRIVGKRDEQGRTCIPAHGELDAERLVPLLCDRLAQRIPRSAMRNSARPRTPPPIIALAADTPVRGAYFCSGCPHNRSTVVPDGAIAIGGIGCHGLVHGMERSTVGLAHMGGEGAQWAGLAPFTELPHVFQNIGDGTLFHSGSLAIRQAIAADANITYKILYNNAVGMTGGQPVDGTMSVPALTRALEAEGVRRIIVTSDAPEKYAEEERFAPGVEVWHRDRLIEAQDVLRTTPGVTVLIHDQMCAAELRRQRRRGRQPDPALRVLINEAVCEGCGDCGVQSNCLSVLPVDTEYGRKTRIHQSSCNKDYSCLLGDCPAFLTITPADGVRPPRPPRPELPDDLAEPVGERPAAAAIYLIGIGGTGVVTVNQVLGTAALLDSLQVIGLDQTGLSQKGGQVVSHLKLSSQPFTGANRVGNGMATCYLAFDLLSAAAAPHLSRVARGVTTAIVSTSAMPTGAMVRSPEVTYPAQERLIAQIEQHTTPGANTYLDAVDLADRLFGDHLMANMIVLGAAYQRGLLPVSAASIERAIELNGVAVERNREAFRVGRMVVIDPGWADAELQRRTVAPRPVVSAAARTIIETIGAEGELLRLLEIRVPELIAYQDAAYAREYAELVRRVVRAEADVLPGSSRLSEAVARYLFKLMAYKDEYEVARLSLQPELTATIDRQFGAGARRQYQLLPPFLRALGRRTKIGLGAWFDGVYHVLVRLRGLRRTPFDPFGQAPVRRVERALIGEYRQVIEAELAVLTAGRIERAVAIAELPDMIRGYEEIKLRNVARYRTALAQLVGATDG